MAAPAAGPQAQSPPAAPCIHCGKSQLALKLSGTGKRVTKRVAEQKSNAAIVLCLFYAVISKNLRFMKNTHLEGEMHQGLVMGVRSQRFHPFAKPAPSTRGVLGCRKAHASLSCFTLDCKQAAALAGQPLPTGSSSSPWETAFPPGACSWQWQTNQPLPFEATLTQDPKNMSSWCQPCALGSHSPDAELTHHSWSTLPARCWPAQTFCNPKPFQ